MTDKTTHDATEHLVEGCDYLSLMRSIRCKYYLVYLYKYLCAEDTD